MPIIQFDVLIPAGPAVQLRDVFTNAINILVKKGRLAEGAVTHQTDVSVDEQVLEQLQEVYRKDHGTDLEGGSINRYLIEAAGEHVSYNQLAMALSRILTPEASLPADPVALERETAYETASAYPWTVEILR